MVSGTRLEFSKQIDLTHKPRDSSICMNKSDSDLTDTEIANMLKQNIIKKVSHERGEFISTIFTKAKQDGGLRVILNLKRFNNNLEYKKHKMTGFKESLNLVTQNCFFGSCDLKSAYYSIPIHATDQKYLKFIWKGQLYQFTCYSNGLCQAPRWFTKLTKPIFAFLHTLGYVITGYLDDSLIVSENREQCLNAIAETVSIFDELGFTIHPEKSILVPCHEIIYLGFVINSINMTVRLTDKRKDALKQWATYIYNTTYNTIREVAKLVGLMVSSFPGVTFGPLYYRTIEREKFISLKNNSGNWEKTFKLSEYARAEIKWWIDNVDTAVHKINQPEPTLVLKTDASLLGWGVHRKDTEGNQSQTGGAWLPQEVEAMHINELEAFAAFLGLKTYAKNLKGKHILIYLDNNSAMLCIRKFGSSKSIKLDKLVKIIWKWCIERKIWLSVARIAGADNIEADYESRNCNVNPDGEYKLNTELLNEALIVLNRAPNIDLFASRTNFQFKTYMSFRDDPEAIAIDSMIEHWKQYDFYAFPPFSILLRVLKKIRDEKATGVIVTPLWRTATFFPVLMRSLIATPVILPARRDLLNLPSSPEMTHPLHAKLRLLVCVVSGDASKTRGFQSTLQTSSWRHGGQRHKRATQRLYTNGNFSLLGQKWIPFHRL